MAKFRVSVKAPTPYFEVEAETDQEAFDKVQAYMREHEEFEVVYIEEVPLPPDTLFLNFSLEIPASIVVDLVGQGSSVQEAQEHVRQQLADLDLNEMNLTFVSREGALVRSVTPARRPKKEEE